jgi:hypothetical protein
VNVCRADHHTERDAPSVRNKVALRARFSFIRRIVADFVAPFLLGWKPSLKRRVPTLFGRLRQGDPRAPGAAAPRLLPPATHASAAST